MFFGVRAIEDPEEVLIKNYSVVLEFIVSRRLSGIFYKYGMIAT